MNFFQRLARNPGARAARKPVCSTNHGTGRRRTITLEQLESRWVRAGLPFGAAANDTGEFMLGRVAVTPVLLESNGQIDASTENWTAAYKDAVIVKLNESLAWWRQLLDSQASVHSLDFVIDSTYVETPSPTAYEPINRRSDDYSLWTQEFLMRTGFDQTASLEENMRAFNNAQRLKLATDWAFTVFVVNSQAEGEGTFAPGGSFSRAFAFAGGLFYVVPSTRPASTFAHETGHMFWARDEYAGSASYYAQRGYYNTQNTNAIDGNPTTNFQQAASIMSAGVSLSQAYTEGVSPASTLAMIGWQDSDGDGIFDVLDVPLSLDGVGRVDVNTGSYRFVGTAKVQTLANLNSSGLANDITLNRISRIEARLNGGSWETVASPDVYEATLSVSVPLAGLQSGTIEIRAIDDETGITSNVFTGQIGALPDATPEIGINGFLFNDSNANGLFDATESGLGAQAVQLVDGAGSPLMLDRLVEPDAQVPGPFVGTAYVGVVISAIGQDANGNVGSFADVNATTGARVFRPYSISRMGYADTWNERRALRVEFVAPTSSVAVDVIGSGVSSWGRLELFDANNKLLQRVTSDELAAGQSQRLEVSRAQADVAYIVVRGHRGSGVKIDNLAYGPRSQVLTDASGRYNFTGLPAGVYNVQVVPQGVTARVTSPGGALQTVEIQAQEAIEHINYGINFQNSAWHNAQIAEDVNADGLVTAMDALLVVNLLNQNVAAALTGSGLPSQPYIDVSNDAFLTALDALLVINAINLNANGGGEGAQAVGSDEQYSRPANGSPEGEACKPFDYLEVVASRRRLAAEGETTTGAMAPALPSGLLAPGSLRLLPANGLTGSFAWTEGESDTGAPAECIVEQLGQDDVPVSPVERELLSRLQANPWSLPQPCNCPECLATELTSLRLS